MSKREAEDLTVRMNSGSEQGLHGHATLVSIGSPDDSKLKSNKAESCVEGYVYRPANIDAQGWIEVIKLEFNDIDPSHCSDKWLKQWVLFDDVMADQVIDMFERTADKASVYAVHCEAGISRSAAIAKFAATYFNFPFPESYMLYNKHVYTTLVRRWRQRIYNNEHRAL